jgi:hypothetical protein
MKKSNNTSSPNLGSFTKIVGQYLHVDDERTRLTIGARYDYDRKKSRIIIRLEKLNELGENIQSLSFNVKKKDIKKLVSCLEFVLKHGIEFIDSLDEEIND